jgi:hypothetical protein
MSIVKRCATTTNRHELNLTVLVCRLNRITCTEWTVIMNWEN